MHSKFRQKPKKTYLIRLDNVKNATDTDTTLQAKSSKGKQIRNAKQVTGPEVKSKTTNSKGLTWLVREQKKCRVQIPSFGNLIKKKKKVFLILNTYEMFGQLQRQPLPGCDVSDHSKRIEG